MEINDDSSKLNEKVTSYGIRSHNPLKPDPIVQKTVQQYKLMRTLYNNGINEFKRLCNDEYSDNKGDCNYNIYSHCDCGDWCVKQVETCSAEGCDKTLHKMCFYRM